MRSNLSIVILLCAGLVACIARSTEALPEPSTGSNLDASSNRDSSADATGGGSDGNSGNASDATAGNSGAGEGGAGGEGGMSTAGEDSGKSCDKECPTAAKSWCDPDVGDCAACENTTQCSAFLGTTPVCKAGVGCVECTSDTNGDKLCTDNGKVCKAGGNVCVECNVTGDCDASSDTPVCADDSCRGCLTNDECTGGTTCDEDSGKCVQCTRDDRDACAVDGMGRRDVCNADSKTCEVGVKEGSAPLCGSITVKQCVSNDECPTGSTCVQEFLGGQTFSGWFCMPTQGSALCKRPFAGEATKPTRDAAAAAVCTLPLSTCTAHSQYRNTSCESAPASGMGDNTKCGVSGVDDGYCVNGGGVLGFVCTLPCTAALDCPSDAAQCADKAHATGTRALCSI